MAGVLVVVALAGAALIGFVRTSRQLPCESLADPRASRLCHALEREMEWRWLGHAIVAPRWRVTFESAARVYCKEALVAGDVDALLMLLAKGDAQLENGAQFLLRLLGAPALDALRSSAALHARPVGETIRDDLTNAASRFHPANPGHPLLGGCLRSQQS